MTAYRTNLRVHEAAAILGVSTKSVVRYVAREWLSVASWDAQGRRFREVDVLSLKSDLNKGKKRSGASCETSRARAVGGNATANANYAGSCRNVGGSHE